MHRDLKVFEKLRVQTKRDTRITKSRVAMPTWNKGLIAMCLLIHAQPGDIIKSVDSIWFSVCLWIQVVRKSAKLSVQTNVLASGGMHIQQTLVIDSSCDP